MWNEIGRERDRYEARLKWERDHRAILQEAEDTRAEGYAQGLAEAKLVRRIYTSQRLLNLPQTPREELYHRSTDELQELAAALERQLGTTERYGNDSPL